MAAVVARDNIDLTALHDYLAAQAARICPAGVPANPSGDRRHHNVQAEEDGPGRAGLQSAHDRRPDLFQRSAAQGLRAARCRACSTASMPARCGCEPRRRRCRPTGRADVLARRRTGTVVQEGPGVRCRDRGALSCHLRTRRGRRPVWLGGDARGRAGARHRARPVSPQHVPRPGRALMRPTRWPATSPGRALARGFDREVPHQDRQFFYLPFMHAEDLADQERCVALSRASATTTSPNMPNTMPTSSAASAAFPTATPCWAAPPRRRSRNFSTLAASPGELTHDELG